jgi:hypothetical protein
LPTVALAAIRHVDRTHRLAMRCRTTIWHPSPVKIHLLRRESVTPIALYVARRDEQPESFHRQLEFGTVLLYREREYRSMYSSDWLVRGIRPAPSADSPFQPYDLTPEAAAHLAALRDGVQALDAPRSPDDLFGLKRAALDGLRRTLRPVKAHAFGWLVAWRFHGDLVERAEAAHAAARAGDLGEAQIASALRAPLPNRRALDAFEERIRRRALGARSAVEGAAFTRYLTTEGAFCEQERAAALAGFDESRVPAELRPLVALAGQVGIGDDACRGWFIRKLPARDRRAAKALIAEHGAAIDAWLATHDRPYEGEAAAFFWLREAGEEL